MLSRSSGDRTLPTLITLLVVGVLLMTFDVRLQGGGVVGVLRSGVQSIVNPLQEVASYVVDPVADMFESLSNVASLREENLVLREELAEAEAAIVAVQDQLARLELLEQLYEMEASGAELGRTVANVTGRPDQVALVIDKGTADGIAPGQPVVDTNGYVVGTIEHVTAGSATVVPITAGPSGVTVLVGEQVGTLMPQIGSDDMRLEILEARGPVLVGDRVVTSAASVDFPAGLPVGEVLFDAAPSLDVLNSWVRPYFDLDTLRIVVVLAWPPDPIGAVGGEEPVGVTTTTLTSVPDEDLGE
ncbi:MAG: rod shape-determining protein MreC [Acidimicrobiia bacterium]|nr:rod shape-determining protein MreC [Acidimicrobiia bacterium]